MELETRSVYELDLELRQAGGRPVISGSFPYGQMATVARMGGVRKERFSSRAFRFAIEEEPEREINFLYGHSFNRSLASRQAGTLEIEDGADAVRFQATLPPEGEQPSWIVDFILAHRAGLIRGISPGFTVPPRTVVAAAEETIPEPGNPGVFIRQINQAVLSEFSAVTRPAYQGTGLEERAEGFTHYWQIDQEMLRWL